MLCRDGSQTSLQSLFLVARQRASCVYVQPSGHALAMQEGWPQKLSVHFWFDLLWEKKVTVVTHKELERATIDDPKQCVLVDVPWSPSFEHSVQALCCALVGVVQEANLDCHVVAHSMRCGGRNLSGQLLPLVVIVF